MTMAGTGGVGRVGVLLKAFPPTLGHVLLSVLPFGSGWAVGGLWAGALCTAWAWFMREFAQSMRPSAPMRIVWTWTNTRNAVVPTLAAVAVAVLAA